MGNPKTDLIDRILNFRKKRRIDNSAITSKSPIYKQYQQASSESFKKGTEFEAFVVRRFDRDYFTLIEWRSDKCVDGIFPIMSKFPDLEFYFESKTQTKYFAVECKWRETLSNDCLLLDKFHIENYKHYESATGNLTFLVIGIGNTPTNPNQVYTIPLREITTERIHDFNLQVYRRENSHDNFFLNCDAGYLR
jgi:hypothetical protein